MYETQSKIFERKNQRFLNSIFVVPYTPYCCCLQLGLYLFSQVLHTLKHCMFRIPTSGTNSYLFNQPRFFTFSPSKFLSE